MQSKISFFLTKSEEWFCRRTRLDTIVQCGNKSPAASGFYFLILATGLWVVIKISHSTFNLDPGSWISLLNPIAGWGRPCWKPWRSWVVTARPSPCPNTSLLFLMMMMMMMMMMISQLEVTAALQAKLGLEGELGLAGGTLRFEVFFLSKPSPPF